MGKPPRMTHAELIKYLQGKVKDGSLLQAMKSMEVELIVSKSMPDGHAKVILNRTLEPSNSKLDAIFKAREEAQVSHDKNSVRKAASDAVVNLSLVDLASRVGAGLRYGVAEAFQEKKGGLDAAKDSFHRYTGVSEQAKEALFQSWEHTLKDTHGMLRLVEERIVPADRRVPVPMSLAGKAARSGGDGNASGSSGGSVGNADGGGSSGGAGGSSGGPAGNADGGGSSGGGGADDCGSLDAVWDLL